MKMKLSDHFSLKKLLWFSAPSIVMMVFTSMYTIVDGLFVSNMAGADAFASLNLIWPVIGILSAFGFMIGAGGSALVSMTLGEQKKDKASEYFTMMVVFEIIGGLIFSLLVLLNIRQIALWCGASEDLMQDAITYGSILASFLTFGLLAPTFNSFMVVDEKPRTGLVITVISGVCNMILDYVFIVPLHMGIAGAATATGLSWVVGSIIPALIFFKGNGTIRFCRFSWNFRKLLKACANGASEMVTNISANLIYLLYNLMLLRYIGSEGVVAYGVIQYVLFLFTAADFGYVMAVSPIIGYQYGAGNRKELKSLYKKSMTIVLVSSLLLFGAAEILAPALSAVFVSYSERLMALTQHGIHLFAVSFLFSGLNIFASGFFTALNNGLVSGILSFVRTFILQAGCVLILPLFLSTDGIWMATAVAEGIACLSSIWAFAALKKKYGY